MTVVLIILGLGLYVTGYVKHMKHWILRKYSQYQMFRSLLIGLNQFTKPQSSRSGFAINDSERSATIIYERTGIEYTVMIPFNRRYIIKMSQFVAELEREGASSIKITQQPGIPYLVSAFDLGGTAIKITNTETGKFHSYKDKIPPLYGVEVFEDEE